MASALSAALIPENVPLRSGPPTREELLVHYPAKFTWEQLKTFVNSGDLGLLKRDKKLQTRYDTWSAGIRKEYGSMVNYLLTYRLQWGKPDALALIPSILNPSHDVTARIKQSEQNGTVAQDAATQPGLSRLPADASAYFDAGISPELISIIMNDWPYSVPPEIEHTLIWTRVPIYPPTLPPSIEKRLLQDGLWGFTGTLTPPPSPDTLSDCLPALADWGVTIDKLVRSPPDTEEEQAMIDGVGKEVDTFIRRRWIEEEWETAWFVNPPRLQSVPGLAHIHVFARHKSPEEIEEWNSKRAN
ncbi:hypothetical protein WOLCODRAFT_88342 [Wolfiporia cocos MD-104 SS10]|uniref:Uncharacterized protein n=1 Tax=Wolfiporia cocos (strain MD-104) TaxID=742152 RepID=A0A2H3JEB2_WOLCO|nr:hypothetical protein WOLCODRAFT_88342 [Wolfiporia cocos MD-104 SS10]